MILMLLPFKAADRMLCTSVLKSTRTIEKSPIPRPEITRWHSLFTLNESYLVPIQPQPESARWQSRGSPGLESCPSSPRREDSQGSSCHSQNPCPV